MNPIARPRRSGATSTTVSAWLIGSTPPSAMPISRRTANNRANEATMPESAEQIA